jgi:hypothetical protein
MGANQTVTVDGEQITYSKISRFYYENKPLDVCENELKHLKACSRSRILKFYYMLSAHHQL